MFAALAFGAAFGVRFRIYSIATIVILLAFGTLTSSNTSRVAANLPTPWVGLWERISIVVFLIWVVVMAVVLLRTRRRQPEPSLIMNYIADFSPCAQEIHFHHNRLSGPTCTT